jgi:hypothetical protein
MNARHAGELPRERFSLGQCFTQLPLLIQGDQSIDLLAGGPFGTRWVGRHRTTASDRIA